MNDNLRAVLREPLVMLVTVPAAIALSIGLLAGAAIAVDALWTAQGTTLLSFEIAGPTARSILATIAGSAITALSLTYSLVLLVFTLAAAIIGPRLLQRFTSEPVNQITAGIFAGTFLAALLTLFFVHEPFVPQTAIVLTGLLAALSVLQLVYFVRHVSKSVTIDSEIAAISERLRTGIYELVRETSKDAEEAEIDREPGFAIPAPCSGYIGRIEEAELIAIASKDDIVIRLAHPAGHFVLEGSALAFVSAELGSALVEEITSRIALDPVRSAARNVEFSIHLLVEIALRALSPGTNDTYTAIACTDRLAAALAEPMRSGLRSLIRSDDEGIPRLHLPGLGLDQLVGAAFHPLRRAAADNVLMAERLAGALRLLHDIAGDDGRALTARHAGLLLESLAARNRLGTDIDSVAEWLGPDLAEAARDAG